jgi:hypothetical protein
MLIALLILLLISFTFHLFFLIRFVTKPSPKGLKWFINTAVSNIVIAGCISFLVLVRPQLVRELDFTLVMWIISGYMMLLMLVIKINILRILRRRMNDPRYYHKNFFGKKVLHSDVISRAETLTFFMTLPIFLVSGAHFVARLINYILYGRL